MYIEKYFSTPDLNLAVAVSLSYPLDCIEKLSDKKSVFVFKREEGLDQLMESFWKRELRVEPIQFSEQKKLLLARIGNREGCDF
jgi:hypothetical protein